MSEGAPGGISLDDQIACVDRELGFRRKTYPRFVAKQQLIQKTADLELARMEAVRGTLAALRRAGPHLEATLNMLGVVE